MATRCDDFSQHPGEESCYWCGHPWEAHPQPTEGTWPAD